MNENLASLQLSAFTEALISKAPVPGGGGAAALVGSLAASLGGMAANLTVGKKKFLPYEEDHRRIIAEADALRQRLLTLMEEDASAFRPLSQVYSLDKASPGYAEKLETATLNACQAPFEMMECCCGLVSLLEELLGKCSVLLLSDVGCAALAARCALEAASMNVFVNTRTLPDNAESVRLSDSARDMLKEFVPRAQAVADSVMMHLQDTR